jgi:diguanylate cyclase (GGDEF)-like protein
MNLEAALGLWLANSCVAGLFGYWMGRTGFGQRKAGQIVGAAADPVALLDELRSAADSANADFEVAIAELSEPPQPDSPVWLQRVVTRVDQLLATGRQFEKRLGICHKKLACHRGGIWPAIAVKIHKHREQVLELCRVLDREVASSISPTASAIAALLTQVRSLAEQNRSLREELVEVKARLAEREASLSEAEKQARIDALTRLPNRRSFDERLAAAQTRAEAGVESFAIVLFDLDRFKDLNDRFGHPFGDAVLSVFGRILSDTIRASDHAARFGGEEFAVLLPGADWLAANAVAERCRRQAERSVVRRGSTQGSFTVSGGVAAWQSGRSAEELLAAADRALYAAKADGRNRVHIEPMSVDEAQRSAVSSCEA